LYGVTAQSNIYVGGGTHYSGASAPTMLANGYCLFAWGGKSYSLNNCMYLKDEPGKFEWVPSRNGVTETGAVRYKGVPVGRVHHNWVIYVGKISSGDRRIYFPVNGAELNKQIYEALVYDPNRSEPSK
jgi:Protein of unknown function (DUF3421)